MADDNKTSTNKDTNNGVFNITGLVQKNEDDKIIVAPIEGIVEEVPKKKKRGRPPKEDTKGMVRVEESQRELNPLETNTPYINSYKATSNQLKATVAGIDTMVAQIHNDLMMVRNSKTLRRKYDYICELAGTEAGLISNRIAAIREINNTITNAHKLEMTRAKESNAMGLAIKDDDKAIMDMYNAYINTPMGMVSAPPQMVTMNSVIAAPTLAAMPINTQASISTESADDAAFEQFKASQPVELGSIAMERNPNIKNVVVYNQETADKYFDVIDITTGQSVPGVTRPGAFLLRDMEIDIRNGIARNVQMNMDFPLVLVGNRKIDEY